MYRRMSLVAGILTIVAAPLMADFTYQETTTITGGAIKSMLGITGVFPKAAREPIVATIALKGDRMIHKTNDHASIVDLGSQTITFVDFQKKQYSVMTFDEMKQVLYQMARKMQEENKGELNFKVSANRTGKTKQVSGFDAKEVIIKMEMEGTDKQSGQKGGMTVQSSMWIAPGIAGYQDVRYFYQRMSEKLNWAPGGNAFMQNPGIIKGMAEVQREAAKLDGVPVEQNFAMYPSGVTPPEPGSTPPPQQQAQPEKPSLGGALGGALGGRFGLGRKKTSSDQSQKTEAAPSGSLLEMTTQLASFSTSAVEDSVFAVPANFKKVDSNLKKMM